MQENQDNKEIFLQLTSEFKDESDRAVALLAAAYLDELLKNLISSVLFIESENVRKDLFKGSSAPLATFSSRILMAFCMRLINENQKIDLNLIRSVRNDFAHKLLGLNFKTQRIANSCNSLIGAKVSGTPATNREKFIKASVRLMVELIVEIQEREDDGKKH